MLKKKSSAYHFVLLAIGLFFMFSGLLKLNDPVGFAWKIEAYLRAFTTDLHQLFSQFLPYTLPVAIAICMLEVMLGLALVCRYKIKAVLMVLMGLMLFFTMLTGYTIWGKRIDSCGCLSEAIPLTPLQSFFKNILLLFLIGWLMRRNKYLPHATPALPHLGLLTLVGISSLGIGLYTWLYLPMVDFGYYSIGTYIPKLTEPKKLLRYQYWLEKEGQITTTARYPTDGTYRLIKTELLNPTDRPSVTNFTIWNEEKETTQELLVGNKLICILKRPHLLTIQTYEILQTCIQQSAQPIDMLVLLPFHETKEHLPSKAKLQVSWGSSDLLQSMMRSDVGFMLLQNGTIQGKWPESSLSKLCQTLQQLT